MLEHLAPIERAVFLLREVFEYEYAEIASMLGLSAANCRQIFHRAQQRVAERRPRFEPSQEAQRQLVERFLRASQNGDMAGLTELLTHDVVTWSDGGGKVSAARQPVVGRDKVLRFIVGLLHKALLELRVELAMINGAPAILLYMGGDLYNAISFEIGNGQIYAIHAVLNPDKLAYLRRQLERSA
jgi:RNA polymerase sigma-70 factor (ECF subfamily)